MLSRVFPSFRRTHKHTAHKIEDEEAMENEKINREKMDTLLAFCTCIFSTWMNIQLPATWKCTGFNIVLHSVKSIHMEAAKTLQLFVFLRIPSILYQHWIITAQTHTHYCVTRITFFSFIEITAHSKHTKKSSIHPETWDGTGCWVKGSSMLFGFSANDFQSDFALSFVKIFISIV